MVSMLYYLFRMAFERRPDAPFRWLTLNSGNLIFYPSDLTAKGRLYRKRVLVSFVVFIGAWAMGMAIGLMSPLAQP